LQRGIQVVAPVVDALFPGPMSSHSDIPRAGPLPVERALVEALSSRQPAKAWNQLRDAVCERVRIMRLAGESKATVIATLTRIAHGAMNSDSNSRELVRVAEDLILEVALWCIDESDAATPKNRPA
jgi:hypothetical protein